jgi:hypothetical protein
MRYDFDTTRVMHELVDVVHYAVMQLPRIIVTRPHVQVFLTTLL